MCRWAMENALKSAFFMHHGFLVKSRSSGIDILTNDPVQGIVFYRDRYQWIREQNVSSLASVGVVYPSGFFVGRLFLE